MLAFAVACLASGGTFFVFAVRLFSEQANKSVLLADACKTASPEAIPVTVDDDTFYVADIMNIRLERWDSGSLNGNMLFIAQKEDETHSCHAVVFRGTQFTVPDGYSQVTRVGAVFIDEDAGDNQIMVVLRRTGKLHL